VAAAGNPNVTDQLLKGVQMGDRSYKNHLDGYNQLDLLQGKGPSARHEFFYFGGPQLGAIRIDEFKFQSSSSHKAGPARRSRPTCRPWSHSPGPVRANPFDRSAEPQTRAAGTKAKLCFDGIVFS
jgi:arylsulfatase A-like enzyme